MKFILRTIATAMLALLLTLGGYAGWQAGATDPKHPAERPHVPKRVTQVSDRRIAIFWIASRLRPCPQEDSHNCYWNASEQGNHRGRSFIDLNGHTYHAKGLGY